MSTRSKPAVRRLHESESGASSVLVLLVLLLLVFLAVLAFVTTGSNLRLARKNAETVQTWYRMDAAGERMAAKALQTVRGAAEQAQAWLDGNRFLDGEQDVLPAPTITRLKAEWTSLETEAERSAFREALFPAVHGALAAQALRKAFPESAEVPDAAMALSTGMSDTATNSGPQIRLTVEDPEGKAASHLEAVLQVLPAQNAAEGGHLRILSWKMVQAPFEYKNEIQLWEGIVE